MTERKLAEGVEADLSVIVNLVDESSQCSSGRAAIARLRALLEVSAGEALRSAHEAIKRIEPIYRKGWTIVGTRDAHAALDAAVAAAVRGEREACAVLMETYEARAEASAIRSRCEVKE
jgi:hypothetical protein